jgi:hypothetical protein
MGKRERGQALAELFRVHQIDLTDLAVASGATAPAEPLINAFADLYEQWRDVPDPVAFLRRRAVAAANPVAHVGAVHWLRTQAALDDESIADIIGVSPAEVSLIGAPRV